MSRSRKITETAEWNKAIALVSAFYKNLRPDASPKVSVSASFADLATFNALAESFPTDQYIAEVRAGSSSSESAIPIRSIDPFMVNFMESRFAGTVMAKSSGSEVSFTVRPTDTSKPGSGELSWKLHEFRSEEDTRKFLSLFDMSPALRSEANLATQGDAWLDHEISTNVRLRRMGPGRPLSVVKWHELWADVHPDLESMREAFISVYGNGRVFYEPLLKPECVEQVARLIADKTRRRYLFKSTANTFWQVEPAQIPESIYIIGRRLRKGESLDFRWSGFRWGDQMCWDANCLVLRRKSGRWRIEIWVEIPEAIEEAVTLIEGVVE